MTTSHVHSPQWLDSLWQDRRKNILFLKTILVSWHKYRNSLVMHAESPIAMIWRILDGKWAELKQKCQATPGANFIGEMNYIVTSPSNLPIVRGKTTRTRRRAEGTVLMVLQWLLRVSACSKLQAFSPEEEMFVSSDSILILMWLCMSVASSCQKRLYELLSINDSWQTMTYDKTLMHPHLFACSRQSRWLGIWLHRCFQNAILDPCCNYSHSKVDAKEKFLVDERYNSP